MVSSPDKEREPPAFVVMSVVLDTYSSMLEDSRIDLDRQVCGYEANSGVAIHVSNSTFRSTVSEYASLQRRMHVLDALIVVYERMFVAAADFATFLIQDYEAFEKSCHKYANPIGDAEHMDRVKISLNLSQTLCMSRVEVSKTLIRRVQIQIAAVSNSS